MPPIRVLLVADRLLCDLLASQLTSRREATVVGQCRGGDRWVEIASVRAVDVVVLDLGSSPVNWPGAVSELRARRADVRVIALGTHRDNSSVIAAARAGAAGWLLPGSGFALLIDALVAVHGGAAVYPPRQLADVLEVLRGDIAGASRASGRLAALTARELDVLRGLVRGLPARELAEQLGLALNTVRTHTNRIFRKLGVNGRLEAVRLARAEGLDLTGGEDPGDGNCDPPLRSAIRRGHERALVSSNQPNHLLDSD